MEKEVKQGTSERTGTSTRQYLHKKTKNTVVRPYYEKKLRKNYQSSHGMETGKENSSRQTNKKVDGRSRRES